MNDDHLTVELNHDDLMKCFYRIPWRINALWCLIAFVLFLSSASLLFRDWSNTKERNYWHPNMQHLDLVLATASVSLVTSVIYIIDLLLNLRFGVTGDLE